MKGIRIILVLLLVFALAPLICAQEPNDSLVTKSNVKPFVTLYHQHHDFLEKPFHFKESKVVSSFNGTFIWVYMALFLLQI
jgi:hypothetical protein